MDPFFEINCEKSHGSYLDILPLCAFFGGIILAMLILSLYGKQNGDHFTTLKHYISKFIMHICFVSLLL